jgi:hypothetical protein
MKHYVYKITDRVTGQYYFGSRSHINPQFDTYVGSMKIWKPDSYCNLVKEILRDDFNSREDAIEYESYMIQIHIDDELNENYHIPNKGFHTKGSVLEENHKYKISKNRKDSGVARGENNPMYGKNHSENSKIRMRNKAYGRWTLEWFIAKYGEKVGRVMYDEKRKSHSSKISGSNHPRYGLKGKNNPMYGRVVTDDIRKKISKSKSNPVFQFTIDGIFIKMWNSVKEAADGCSIHINTIYHNLKGRRNNGGGFIWKYDGF